MAQLVLPRVLAMVICDDVAEAEDEAGVVHLTGVRTVIETATFPTVQSLCVFVELSGHEGEAICHVQVESLETGELVTETEPHDVVFEEPSKAVPEYFRLINCVFSAPGVYFVQMYNGRKLIGERRLNLRWEE